jgi:hypothetical protein
LFAGDPADWPCILAVEFKKNGDVNEIEPSKHHWNFMELHGTSWELHGGTKPGDSMGISSDPSMSYVQHLMEAVGCWSIAVGWKIYQYFFLKMSQLCREMYNTSIWVIYGILQF